MAHARTHPSLRTRIIENRRGIITIPADGSGITKPTVGSFAERYRGTEYETHRDQVVVSEPLASRGRLLWLVSAAGASVVIGLALAGFSA
jgi:hypothetical protein